jgi:CRP/FNR family transcriptional regulator, anaerobic regulatory protein
MALLLTSQMDIMDKIAPMPEALKAELFREAIRMDMRKKQVLLRPDEICDYLYFIEEGVLTCYGLKESKRYYLWLMGEGDIATEVTSFNLRVPSKQFIEAQTRCVLYLLSWEQLERLTHQYKEFGTIRQRISDKYHIQIRDIDDIRSHGAEELYDYLVATNPIMIKQVTNSILASYLRISEAKLYRIKRDRRGYK